MSLLDRWIASLPKVVTCVVCEAELSRTCMSQTCSKKCWKKLWRQRPEAKARQRIHQQSFYERHPEKRYQYVSPSKRNCRYCDASFEATHGTTYCSQSCRREAQRDSQRSPPKFRECVICGVRFQVSNPRQNTCGPDCRVARARHMRVRRRSRVNYNTDHYRKYKRDQMRFRRSAQRLGITSAVLAALQIQAHFLSLEDDYVSGDIGQSRRP